MIYWKCHVSHEVDTPEAPLDLTCLLEYTVAGYILTSCKLVALEVDLVDRVSNAQRSNHLDSKSKPGTCPSPNQNLGPAQRALTLISPVVGLRGITHSTATARLRYYLNGFYWDLAE